MRMVFVGLVVVLVAASGESSQRPGSAGGKSIPPGWVTISPDQLTWTKNPDGTGRENATLFGDRSKHELFGYAVRWPAHTTAKAHSHPENRYVMVLSGTFYHGHGDKFDAGTLEQRSQGTFFTEPAGIAHFGATKDQGTILYFVGIGPDRTDPVEK